MHRGALFTAYLTLAISAAVIGAPYLPFRATPVYEAVVLLIAALGWSGRVATAGAIGVVLWSGMWWKVEQLVGPRCDCAWRTHHDLDGFRMLMVALIAGAHLVLADGIRRLVSLHPRQARD